MVVSYMVTLCVLRLIVRYMAAIVRYMVDCAVYGYCAFYGLYNRLMKNAIYPENVIILLDSTHKSCRDSKSKKSSQKIKFQLTYGYFSRGTVFFWDTLYHKMNGATLTRVSKIQILLFLKCIRNLCKGPVSISGEAGPGNLII